MSALQKTCQNEGRSGTAARTQAAQIVPLLPLRDIIVFPHMVSQLFVGRERSITALDEAMNRDKEIFLAAQKNAKTNEPDAGRHLRGRHLGRRSCSCCGCPTAR